MNETLLAPPETARAGWVLSLEMGVRLRMWRDRLSLVTRIDVAHLQRLRDFRPARVAWAVGGAEPLPDPIIGDTPGGGGYSLAIEDGHPVLRVHRGRTAIAARLSSDNLLSLVRFADQVEAYRLDRTDAIPEPVASGPLVEVAR